MPRESADLSGPQRYLIVYQRSQFLFLFGVKMRGKVGESGKAIGLGI